MIDKDLTRAEKLKKIEELKKKIEIADKEYNYMKAMQLALKLVLNGSYGAICHKAFSVANSDIANAITAMARETTQWMYNNIEEYFYNKWHLDTAAHELLGKMYIAEFEEKFYTLNCKGDIIDKKPFKKVEDVFKKYHLDMVDIAVNDTEMIDKYKVHYKIVIHNFSKVKKIPDNYVVEPDLKSKDWERQKGVRATPLIVYGDTDSCHKLSHIKTNNGIKTIEELYNINIITGDAGSTLKGHESVLCNDNVLNYDKEKGLYYAPVKRIIRHKVTKSKWKLKTKSGKEIIVTNDHSMIVFRDGEQIEVKPKDILKTDKILAIK